MNNILIFSTTFFPNPVVASIRVTAWARHLPKFGWKPIIACRHFGFEHTRNSLSENVNQAADVHFLGSRRAISKPSDKPNPPGLKSRAKNALKALSVPDILIWKQKKLLPQAVEIARSSQPQIVLSTSPEHSIHWLGRSVANKLNVPWVADFRDPYRIDARYKPKGVGRLLSHSHRRFEYDIYRDAHLVVHAIPIHARWAARTFPEWREKIYHLPNGIPESLNDRISKCSGSDSSQNNENKPLRIFSMASLPTELVNDLQIVINSIADEVQLIVCGERPREFQQARDSSNSNIEFLGRLSHESALDELVKADLLLGYLSKKRAEGIGLSSKLFEYLAVGKPIININSTRSDRILLSRKPWCYQLTNPSRNQLEATFQEAIHEIGEVSPDEDHLDRFRKEYDRCNQTQRLAEQLDRIACEPTAKS